MSDLSERLSTMSPKRLALVALELEAKLQGLERSRHEPIAIVGMACRFPGEAADLEGFWRLLHNRRSAVAEVPADRWDADALYDPDPDAAGKVTTRWGGFLRDIRSFDPSFFGIAPREAVTMDPQQRLLLEVAWEALEHAGIPAEQLPGSLTGIFNGICNSDFHQLLSKRPDTSIDAYSASGSAFSIASGRLAYFFGAEGPAVSVDTACSSSLVAVHLACQSLRNDECTLALATGVNVICNPQTTIALSRSHMMAADGRCKTFDAAADGFVRGEGCGVVVLKRLSQAQKDGDRILALIRGTAINQDGRSSGLTAPNGPSQERVIRAALKNANVEADSIDYVEAHGTGTSLGDPIELHALGAVLAPGGRRTKPLAIGSVKTNVGHLEAAAGIAGLIKVVLSLLHEEIPAHLHLRERNPHVAWHTLPFDIPVEPRPWPKGPRPRRAGVSSFGFSGTNGHLVVEEAPSATAIPHEAPELQIITASATTAAALDVLAPMVAQYLASGNAPTLAAAAYTANAGRSHFPHRLAVVASNSSDAAAALTGEKSRQANVYRAEVVSGSGIDLAFLFTGQGSQYPGMSRALYEREPVYRAAIDRADELLRIHLDVPLRAVLFEDRGAEVLDRTLYTQPALFAVEVALAQLWQSWGITPSAVAGHSVGELAACCVAGLFSFEDGLRLIAGRGRLMQALSAGGAMAAIHAAGDVVLDALAGDGNRVDVAAFNGPENTVISGPADTVDTLIARFSDAGIRSTRLRVSHAFHSALIDPMLDQFEELARTVTFTPPTVPIISNLTGEVISFAEISTPTYWRRQARHAVRFSDGVLAARALGCNTFLEIGPHPTLVQMGQALVAEGAAWIGTLRRGHDDRRQMLTALAQLYVAGARVDWKAVAGPHRPAKVTMPSYPFQRSVYWPDGIGTAAAAAKPVAPWNEWLYELDWREQHEHGLGDQIDVIARTIDEKASTVLAANGAQVYERVYPALDALSAAFIVRALADLGCHLREGDRFSTAELAASCGIRGGHTKLFDRILAILAEDGYLAAEAGAWTVVRAPQRQEPEALARQMLAEFPECRAEVTLTARCASGLASVLRGAIDPMQLLFPDGSLEQTESLYERAPVFRVFNDLIAEAVLSAVASLPVDRPLRVLEIGAGTGSTCASVLPGLPADRTEYVFTDVSAAFLSRAQQKFRDYAFVRYRTLDIERDPVAQGFEAGSFDLVIASNVLHATVDLSKTLSRVRPLLADRGMLLLLEGTRQQRFGDLTVGLTDGWWAYADAGLRSYALMPANRWLELLNRSGFEQATALPSATAVAAAIFDNQSIVVARAVAAKPAMSYVIVDDYKPSAAPLLSSLQAKGVRSIVLHPEPTSLERWIPQSADVMPGTWTLVSLAGSRLSLAGVEPGRASNAAYETVSSMLQAVQSAIATTRPPDRIVLVTVGAQAVRGDLDRPLSSIAGGFARTVDLEHPELRCTLLDVDSRTFASGDALARALDSVASSAQETQVAVRNGRRYAARIVPSTLAVETPSILDRLDPGATYLITGGLSGLGLEVARRLVDRGARHLALVGRTAPSDVAEQAIRNMSAAGATVRVHRGDVAVPDVVAEIVQSIPGTAPLRGIVHCAGVTKDASVARQRWDDFREVFSAKVDGTWNLHTLTAGLPLDFFVLFSSGASFTGSKGQANHSAANAFLDAFAAWRRAQGLPGLSINWGAWSEIGAATRGSIGDRVQEGGLRMIDPASGLAVLEHLMRGTPAQVAVLPIDWQAFFARHGAIGQRRVFDVVRPSARAAAAASTGHVATAAAGTLRDLPERRLRPHVLDLVRREAARILCVPVDTLDSRRPLQEVGLDSLMAVELRNVLGSLVGANLSATLLFSYPSVQELATHLADRELGDRSEAQTAPAETASAEHAPEETSSLDDLSEDDLARMLAAKIGAL